MSDIDAPGGGRRPDQAPAGQQAGHQVYRDTRDARVLRYLDNDEEWDLVKRENEDGHRYWTGNRPCAKCGAWPTAPIAGHYQEFGADACLGWLPGVTAACCGHGFVEAAYVIGWDESGAVDRRGQEALDFLAARAAERDAREPGS